MIFLCCTLEPGSGKCDPWTSSIHVTWSLLEIQNLRPHSRATGWKLTFLHKAPWASNAHSSLRSAALEYCQLRIGWHTGSSGLLLMVPFSSPSSATTLQLSSFLAFFVPPNQSYFRVIRRFGISYSSSPSLSWICTLLIALLNQIWGSLLLGSSFQVFQVGSVPILFLLHLEYLLGTINIYLLISVSAFLIRLRKHND